MTPQTLFKPPAPVPHPETWTPNQQTAWALITSLPGGAFADEIGAKIHTHDNDERCNFCGQAGVALCKSKALKGHVIRRKLTGRWEPRLAVYRAKEPSSQLADLPADLFGGV